MNSTTTMLPAEIQKLITQVVRRTRLRKGERADIERELAAHFRDGLASGKSVAQLVEAFGEAKVSAKGIRAGAIAKRSPLDRSLRQVRIVIGWGFVAFLAFYAASVGYLWMHAPVISFDPIERYHAAFPKVAKQDRAWPIYKQGLIALADPTESPIDQEALPNSGSEIKLTFRGLGESTGIAIPSDQSWADLRQALRERRIGIDTLVKAASMPALGYVPSAELKPEDADIFRSHVSQSSGALAANLYLYSIRLPHMLVLRQAARLLAADALVAAEDGEGGRFVRDIEAMIRLSQHVEEGKFLISQLVGTAIRNMAFTRIIMALEWRPEALTDDQLKQLAATLRRIPGSCYEIDLKGEQMGMQDLVQRIYSDNGAGDGWFNPVYGFPVMKDMVAMSWPGTGVSNDRESFDSLLGTIGAPLGAGVIASRKELMELYDSLIRQAEEQSKLPAWKQDFTFEHEFLQRIDGNELAKIKWFIPRLMLPAVSHAVRLRRLSESECVAAQTAIALIQFRRAHDGEWPVSIGQLLPEYLGDLPLDPWSGKLVDFEVIDGHAHVYVLGWRAQSARQDGQPFIPQWKNSSNGGMELDWLWFRGDDKLERWKPVSDDARPDLRRSLP
ncbi:MAG: DUF1700 domain-containing protein [Planctomycetes bacterium]|nr:DUF1700 domain-containing protein [Planctomycetota bacterium]